MKPKVIIAVLACATLVACDNQRAENEALRSENDSLRTVQQQMESEINGYFEAVNTIQQNLDRMKQMEGAISLEPAAGEGADATERINRDIDYLSQMLQKNKSELQALQQRLERSNLDIKQLKQTIASLNRQLEQQAGTIGQLRDELRQKNQIIAQMSDTIRDQSQQLDQLAARTDEQDRTITEHEQTISEHERTISTAWYVFGTRKELKEQGIMSGKSVLQGDFNKDYFVRIDTRKTDAIPLYSTRAKILTTHPAASYTLAKEDGKYILRISNADLFWSISKYLVIEVD